MRYSCNLTVIQNVIFKADCSGPPQNLCIISSSSSPKSIPFVWRVESVEMDDKQKTKSEICAKNWKSMRFWWWLSWKNCEEDKSDGIHWRARYTVALTTEMVGKSDSNSFPTTTFPFFSFCHWRRSGGAPRNTDKPIGQARKNWN